VVIVEKYSPTRILNLQIDSTARQIAQEDKFEAKEWRLEADFQNFVMPRFQVLEEYGFAFAVKHSDRVQVGEPDITAFLPGGETLYFELKRYDGRRSPAQVKWGDRLTAYGFKVFVPKTWVEIKDALHASGVPVYEIWRSRKGDGVLHARPK
jgi:hypothetical protein